MKYTLLLLFALALRIPAQAGSSTWALNPGSNNWNTASNWMPPTVPNAQTDVATFGPSNTTSITVQDHTMIGTAVAAIVFGAEAPAYTITFGDGSLNQTNFDFWGGGVANGSAFEQTFVLPTIESSNTHLTFRNSATAGERTTYICNGGYIYFFNSATAGSANFVIDNGVDNGFSQGSINFVDHSTAGQSTITLMPLTSSTLQDPASGGSATFAVLGGLAGGNTGAFLEMDTTQGDGGTYVAGAGMAPGAIGGIIQRETLSGLTGGTLVADGAGFSGADGGTITLRFSGNAGSSNYFINGATVAGGQGGTMQLQDTSTASSASITINGGTNGGAGASLRLTNQSNAAAALITVNSGTSGGGGGSLSLEQSSTGGTSQVAAFGNGVLKVTLHDAPGTGIGSLAGDGTVQLGANNLTLGNNDLSTTFSGLIRDSGSITKTGAGTLTLASANTYSGGTIVTSGILSVSNSAGSATGTGALTVNGGTLAGGGIVAGAVTGEAGAFLAPAAGTNKQVSLTLQGSLTLQAGATYTYTFKARASQTRSDLVLADGVAINGATIKLRGKVQGSLTPGTVLTVISNTSANPINGTFSNLPDGAIVNVNGNSLQASYAGGDGNDLTLTVVP